MLPGPEDNPENIKVTVLGVDTTQVLFDPERTHFLICTSLNACTSVEQVYLFRDCLQKACSITKTCKFWLTGYKKEIEYNYHLPSAARHTRSVPRSGLVKVQLRHTISSCIKEKFYRRNLSVATTNCWTFATAETYGTQKRNIILFRRNSLRWCRHLHCLFPNDPIGFHNRRE